MGSAACRCAGVGVACSAVLLWNAVQPKKRPPCHVTAPLSLDSLEETANFFFFFFEGRRGGTHNAEF